MRPFVLKRTAGEAFMSVFFCLVFVFAYCSANFLEHCLLRIGSAVFTGPTCERVVPFFFLCLVGFVGGDGMRGGDRKGTKSGLNCC